MGTRSPVALPASADGFFAPVDAGPAGAARRAAAIVAVVGLHLCLLVVLGYAALRPELPPAVRALSVRLLEPAAPSPAKLETPKPPPPQPSPRKVQAPPPVLAAARPSEAPASFVVAPQPAPLAAPPVQAPAPLPIVAARFDADYLQNPKPAYPPMSRRLGEEGKVVLHVRVSAQGQPLAVDIKQSSGFPRLDEAARSAVERWRFVPARQGNEPVETNILVPLNFTLSN